MSSHFIVCKRCGDEVLIDEKAIREHARLCLAVGHHKKLAKSSARSRTAHRSQPANGTNTQRQKKRSQKRNSDIPQTHTKTSHLNRGGDVSQSDLWPSNLVLDPSRSRCMLPRHDCNRQLQSPLVNVLAANQPTSTVSRLVDLILVEGLPMKYRCTLWSIWSGGKVRERRA